MSPSREPFEWDDEEDTLYLRDDTGVVRMDAVGALKLALFLEGMISTLYVAAEYCETAPDSK